MTSNGTPRAERKLPIQQLTILAICRFAEPLSATSLNPYLPEMVRSFGIPDEDVGKWAGICAAAFSVFQALMAIPWGRASDVYGRKPAILLGLSIMLFTTLLWGLSTSLSMAILARAIAGASSGNVGIIRTTVAEMVPYKELQPRAFSIMPLVWNIGSIFGPVIGGALANPLHVKPGERIGGSLLQQFPYLLPNLVSACYFVVAIVVGFLFLKETLEIQRDRQDIGLLLGAKLKSACKLFFRPFSDAGEREPLIKPAVDEEQVVDRPAKSIAPPWKEVLNRQMILCLALYAGLAMHNMAFDQVLPVYMSDKRPDPSAHKDNFLNFSGGFGLSNLQIGMLNTGYAIYGMILQFLLFPPVARRLGALYCMKWASAVFPVAYLLMPFTLLLPSQASQVASCFILQLLKESCALFAFPCSIILLTNSATSMRTLGTVNGVATSVSAIGRAAGPALTGLMYTVGAKHGYLIAPWWFLTAVALVAAFPVHFVVESDSSSDAEPAAGGSDSERDEEVLVAEGIEGEAEAAGQPGPELIATVK